MLADDDADEEEVSEKDSVDSGYSSIAGDDVGDEKTPPSPVESRTSTELPEGEKPKYNGTSHQTRAPKLKRRQIAALAVRFAESIPEREISMASLQVGIFGLFHFMDVKLIVEQGFLMAYKIRPFEAVAEAKAWVEKERKEKLDKQRKDKEVEAEKAKAAALVKEKEAEKAKEAAAEKEKAAKLEETEKQAKKETS